MSQKQGSAGPPAGAELSRRTGSGLSLAAQAAVSAGTPAETSKAYLADVRHYTDWCQARRIQPFPCTADMLTEYATYLTEGRKVAPVPGTIERARWAILKFHRLAGMPPPDTSGLIQVLKGYRARLASDEDPRAAPRKATAADKDALAAIVGGLDLATARGQRDAAIVLLGFAIGARRGELASLSVASITTASRGIQVQVYRRKTRLMDSPVVHFRPNAGMCPARATLRWIDCLAQHGRDTGPLFVRIDRWGNLAPAIIRDGQPIGDTNGRLTGQSVGNIIRQDALAAGLSGKWSGHSLRRGLATAMHEGGQERRLIERQGGWAAGSKAVSGYIDDSDRWLHDVLDGVL